MGEAGVSINKVGTDQQKEYGGVPRTSVVVVKKVTKALIASGVIAGLSTTPEYEEAVNEGFLMGKKLTHYLTARQEEQSLKTTRQKSGRMDGRLINQLGYGEYNVFSTVVNEIINKAHIHISIDASGSMEGRKFYNSIKTATGIAYAASSIQGMECVIDFRHQSESKQPCVIIGYDSRIQKITELKNIMYVNCNALTPEGLCYEAVLDYMVKGNNITDSYLINFSDGEPAFTIRDESNNNIKYSGDTATSHTKTQIDKIKNMGIHVLSYFIDGGYSDGVSDSFKKMYGADSVLIDTNNIQQVAKTVNKLLMK